MYDAFGNNVGGWIPNVFNAEECRYGNLDLNTGIPSYVDVIQTYASIVSGLIPVRSGVTYKWIDQNGEGITAVWGIVFYRKDMSYYGKGEMDAGNHATKTTAPIDGYMRLRFYLSSGYTDATAKEYIRRIMVGEDDFCKIGKVFEFAKLAEPYKSIKYLDAKTIAVIGDSICTWDGHNDVEVTIEAEDVGKTLSAYQTPYDGALTIGGVSFPSVDNLTEITFVPNASDVGKVVGKALTHGSTTRRPWWFWLAKKHNMEVNNVSWSGTSLCSHEGGAYAWHESQIRKCGTRVVGSMERIAPDYIFIARGCNDMTHTPYATINAVFDKNYVTPTNDNKDMMLGLAITISKLRQAYPTSKIIVCTMTPYYRDPDDKVFPMQNGIATEQEYNDAIRKTANFYQCSVCDFDLAFSHLNGGAIGAIGTASDQTHPSNYGHWLMFFKAEQALEENL